MDCGDNAYTRTSGMARVVHDSNDGGPFMSTIANFKPFLDVVDKTLAANAAPTMPPPAMTMS